MDRGRILIFGESKETSFELRNLFDNHLFELEIALNKDVGKTVLSTRMMNLIVKHSEACLIYTYPSPRDQRGDRKQTYE